MHMWAEGTKFLCFPLKAHLFWTLHQMGDFSYCAQSRFRTFVGRQLSVSFCRDRIWRWETNSGLKELGQEWRCPQNEQYHQMIIANVLSSGLQSPDLQVNWFWGCMGRLQIIEVTCVPPSGERNCKWSFTVGWLVQLQDTWQPAVLLLYVWHSSAS